METAFFSQEFLRETFFQLVFFSLKMVPIWAPLSLGAISWKLWVMYKQAEFLNKQENILIEIKIPKEAPKSPLAMEIVLNSLYITIGESTWYDRYVLGKVRADFSLEIASIDGIVHFFIRTPARFKKAVETQIYSQFSTAEIYEVPDYTATVPYAKKDSDWRVYGTEIILSKPDPYPIKTYIDYGLDKDQFEEKKVDPITAMLESWGSIGKGEQMWFQILVRANKGKKDPTTLWKRDWKDESEKLINEIMEKAKGRSGPPPKLTEGEAEQDHRFSMLTEGERNIIKAIERNVSKIGFDCGIRMLYLGKKSVYDAANIAGLFGSIRQYNSNDLNGFKPLRYTAVDYPWQKYFDFAPDPISINGDREGRWKWKIFDAYRRRSWFFFPYERKPFVLNVEELATIYHFPGRVSETPTFQRLESKRSEPPANLPI